MAHSNGTTRPNGLGVDRGNEGVEGMSASVETVEGGTGSTNHLPPGVSLANRQGSTHSTVSTVSTLIK